MKGKQLDLVEGLTEKLPEPAQWIGFLERLVPAVYGGDPELSNQCKRARDDFDYFVKDIACIDFDEHFPKPVTARIAIDYLYGKKSRRRIDLRRVLARVDQILGRQRVLELADAV